MGVLRVSPGEGLRSQIAHDTFRGGIRCANARNVRFDRITELQYPSCGICRRTKARAAARTERASEAATARLRTIH